MFYIVFFLFFEKKYDMCLRPYSQKKFFFLEKNTIICDWNDFLYVADLIFITITITIIFPKIKQSYNYNYD
jgi:hypothetical protein